jgi:DNA ligase (NAD+)
MEKQDTFKRIQQLRQELDKHNHNYYVLNTPEISDFEYDQLMAELIRLEFENPEFQSEFSPSLRVGSDLSNKFETIKHEFPMLSLGNTYSEAELIDFHNRVFKLTESETEYVCELKYDGVSISVLYENGEFSRAVTRGDGVQGDDVSENVKTIRSIPLKLKDGDYPEKFEIRGEIFMSHKVFSQLNEERRKNSEQEFANPRNAAAGSIKLLHSSIVAKRKLDCFFYYLMAKNLNVENHYESLLEADKWGFKVPRNIKLCKTINEVFDYVRYWDENRKNLPYDIDGVVIKVNSFKHQEILGFTSKTPRWAISYKFKAEQALTTILSIDYQVGRTGAITPVANLMPVQLSGTSVKRASLHNADQIALLDIRVGDTVFVEKGGEIIPKIIGVEKHEEDSQPTKFIENCPECNTPLVRVEGEAKHFCPNEDTCPPQIKGKIIHFISRKAMNIDSLGEETVELLYDKRLIRDAADLYSLTKEKLLPLDRIAEKSADNIINNILASRTIPFERVLYALGIRYVGETVAKKLAACTGNIDKLSSAKFEELIQIEEIGDRIAESVINYFNKLINISFIQRLKNAGLQMEAEKKEFLSDKLKGKSIVISGTFEKFSRDELKTLIEKHQGKNISSISKSTSLLVAGENMGPSKLEKARKLGIKIIDEDAFIDLFQGKNKNL